MRSLWLVVLLCLSALTLAGCELAGDIFQAGVWVGVLVVAIIIVIIGVVVSKARS